uniref:Uncharacterized protein n=1 Tax=Pelusios castaneus TaxID=367368 RepID=A0A8C8RFJ1_9SAUR
ILASQHIMVLLWDYWICQGSETEHQTEKSTSKTNIQPLLFDQSSEVFQSMYKLFLIIVSPKVNISTVPTCGIFISAYCMLL